MTHKIESIRSKFEKKMLKIRSDNFGIFHIVPLTQICVSSRGIFSVSAGLNIYQLLILVFSYIQPPSPIFHSDLVKQSTRYRVKFNSLVVKKKKKKVGKVRVNLDLLWPETGHGQDTCALTANWTPPPQLVRQRWPHTLESL